MEVDVNSIFGFGCIDRRLDDPLLKNIYSLRYKVYVEEWGFENPEDHSENLETDDYDPHSVHFYAYYHELENIVGTIRLILSDAAFFPIENEFSIEPLPSSVHRKSIVEISRLAVSKTFRRRAIDRQIFGNEDIADIEMAEIVKEERRKSESELVRGLYLAIYKYCKKNDITHWYAVMTKGLYTILARWGIKFRKIGPEKDYHGIRAPYIACINDIEERLARKNPELLKIAKEKLSD